MNNEKGLRYTNIDFVGFARRAAIGNYSQNLKLSGGSGDVCYSEVNTMLLT